MHYIDQIHQLEDQIKVDGRILAWGFKTKKSAMDNVRATGNHPVYVK